MRIITITLPLLTLLAFSCSTSKKAATVTTTNTTEAEHKRIACEDMPVGNMPHLDWVIEKEKTLDGSGAQLPATYKVYSIDSAQVATFFKAVRNNLSDTALVTAVPLPDGCQLFEVKAVNPKQNTPMTSITGTDEVTRSNMLTLIYDGYNMSGKVIWDNNEYDIKTVNASRHTYYIVYPQSRPGGAGHLQFLPPVRGASRESQSTLK